MGKIKKTETEWKELLDDDTYNITRKSGTEPAFSGQYLNEKSQGVYYCVCCNNELFSSKTKYDSGSGWPSFYEIINNKNVFTKNDHSHGMSRIEILCAKCDSHLGHVFNDGPDPTG